MQISAHPLHLEPYLAGAALYGVSSIWWLTQVLAVYGPSWEALGPILLSVGVLYHGRANYERARRDR